MKKINICFLIILFLLHLFAGCASPKYTCLIYINPNYKQVSKATSTKLNEIKIGEKNYTVTYKKSLKSDLSDKMLDVYTVDGNNSITIESETQKIISFHKIMPFPIIKNAELLSEEQLKKTVESMLGNNIDFSIYNTFEVCKNNNRINLSWKVKRKIMCFIELNIEINEEGMIDSFQKCDYCPENLSEFPIDDFEKDKLIRKEIKKYYKIDNLEGYQIKILSEKLMEYQGKPSLLCRVDIVDPYGMGMINVFIIN